ncbi:Uncharacterised protein [Salmonella enterica subsp. enterica serovar Typhi]|nr:Uncharacterised protein [Salmonella enterica subsp. enterica serovar Typhi]CQS36091.1 Uncharacterised protein [Salmonella enterica subsp. enterica serovar Typhi]
MILFNGVFVVNTGQQTLVSDVQQCHSGGFINTAAFRFNDTVFDLVAHAQAVTSADAVRFQHHLNIIAEGFTVQRHWMSLFETDGHLFCRDLHAFVPELHAHNRVDDLDAGVKKLQIFRFVRRAEHVGVGGVGFFD